MTTDFIRGMDISTLEDTETEGGRFFDEHGTERPLLDILRENGVNGIRLRLWNDPCTVDGIPYGGGTCDLTKFIRLAKRVQDAGMALLLDFHYSDFWCDPARQGTPKAWRGMTLPEMAEALHRFTADTLDTLAAEGIFPQTVQVGNEITNGMCWDSAKLDRSDPAAWDRSFDALALLLRAGCSAVRGHSDAKIILHLEQSGNNALWREWFDAAAKHALDYDIIGASYYPIWHGTFAQLKANLTDMAERYDKDVQIVETAYPFTTEPIPYSKMKLKSEEGFADETGSAPPYPFTREGQAECMRGLLETAAKIPRCTGIYYWEPGWLPLQTSTWATAAALADIGEADKDTGNEWANECLFDYSGRINPALHEFRRADAH